MEKPISMILNETKVGLANICNQSRLPSYMLEPILKDLYLEVKELSRKQLKQDEEMYYASLEQDKAKSKDNEKKQE